MGTGTKMGRRTDVKEPAKFGFTRDQRINLSIGLAKAISAASTENDVREMSGGILMLLSNLDSPTVGRDEFRHIRFLSFISSVSAKTWKRKGGLHGRTTK